MILGLTCISEELKLKDKKKYSFRTMTRKRFNDLCVKHDRNEAIRDLSERILHNVALLVTLFAIVSTITSYIIVLVLLFSLLLLMKILMSVMKICPIRLQ